jgi:hypothetical protein
MSAAHPSTLLVARVYADLRVRKQLDRTKLLWDFVYLMRVAFGTIKWLFVGSGEVRIHKASVSAGDSIAIVAVYRERPDFLELLADLREAGYRLLVIFNRQDIDPSAALVAASDVLVSRQNRGRDFGAYAKGMEIVGRYSASYARILFVNDSCLYLKRSVDLFRALCADRHHYVSLTETWATGGYLAHGGFFQLSKYLVKQRAVAKFFSRYKQISSPRYAVEKGEKRLSRTIIGQLKVNPYVLFPISLIVNQHTARHKLLDEYSGWYGLDDPEEVYLSSNLTRASANLLTKQVTNEAHLIRLRLISSLDPLQDIALMLPLLTSFPFLKINNLARGYCSYQQARYFSQQFPELTRSRIIRELTRTYGQHYASTGISRLVQFAELFSFI